MNNDKTKRASIAGLISVLIIGTAVGLAFAAGSGLDGTPTTVAGQAPESIDYVRYEDPDELIAGHEGRPLVINFFASWCAPCRAELPDFAAAHAAYRDRVDFIGINYQEVSEREAARLLFETGITYPIMEDETGELLQELGTLPTMPTTIFISADGTIVERHHGLILFDQLADRIEETLAAS